MRDLKHSFTDASVTLWPSSATNFGAKLYFISRRRDISSHIIAMKNYPGADF